MESQNGAIDIPVPATCDYLTGFAEGTLLGLNSAKLDDPLWGQFIGSFGSSATPSAQ
jgi:hypothetical protein